MVPRAEIHPPPPRTMGLTASPCPSCAMVGGSSGYHLPSTRCGALFGGALGHPAEGLCQWPMAAMTDYPRFDGPKQQPFSYLGS